MNKAWKIKSALLGASFVVAFGASTAAYATQNVCVTINNYTGNEVQIRAYDFKDAVMWVDLGPGITSIPAKKRGREVCFVSNYKHVKLYYNTLGKEGLLNGLYG